MGAASLGSGLPAKMASDRFLKGKHEIGSIPCQRFYHAYPAHGSDSDFDPAFDLSDLRGSKYQLVFLSLLAQGLMRSGRSSEPESNVDDRGVWWRTAVLRDNTKQFLCSVTT